MSSPVQDAAPEPSRADAAAPAARRSREHALVLALAAVALLGLIVLGSVLEPDPRGVGTHEQLGMRACMTMDLWNVPCPGCGVTTSVTLASRGRFRDAFANQPFGLATFLIAVLFIGWAAVGHLRGRDLWRDLNAWNGRPWLVVLGVLAAVSWAYKLWLVRAG